MLPRKEEETLAILDNYAVYAWLGLASYVFIVDIALGATGHKYMTDAWHEALRHPLHRWIVISAWAFTTKHLFFRDFLPRCDPYGLIALGVKSIKKIKEI